MRRLKQPSKNLDHGPVKGGQSTERTTRKGINRVTSGGPTKQPKYEIPDDGRLEQRVVTLEKQVAALQLVIRELTNFTDSVGEDVDDLLDGLDGGGDSDSTAGTV